MKLLNSLYSAHFNIICPEFCHKQEKKFSALSKTCNSRRMGLILTQNLQSVLKVQRENVGMKLAIV